MITVIFDVNETLLDLRVLDPHFERIFGDAAVRGLWFSQVLQTALVYVVLDLYKPFNEIGRDAMMVVAAKQQKPLTPSDIQGIGGQMRNLPPHPDVPENLKRLQDSGARVVALTNSNQEMANVQLKNAGIADYFHEIMSVEGVSHFKPHPAVYRMAIDRLGITASEAWFVAAHDWDIAGAMAVGLKGASVMRGFGTPNPAYPTPDFFGADMTSVVDHILL